MIPRVILPWATLSFSVDVASAFQARSPSSSSLLPHRQYHTTKLRSSLASTIDATEFAPRDINPLYEWAAGYGVQTAECFELSSEDGVDIYAIANQNLPAESPVVCVPSDLIITGYNARMELGAEAVAAERAIKLPDHVPFYLFLKVLKEYELGEQSPWYTWLNSLPRYYGSGASMTDFCYSCLPPYAAKQARNGKSQLKRFELALDEIPFLSDECKSNSDLTKWAYNVVYTRYQEKEGGDFCLVPMADYFNHGGTEVDVYISFDQEGNCFAYTTRDVPAGQPLKICYGDPTNPSQLLARYGFLDESSPGTYCKWIAEEASTELFNLGYPSSMLFYNDGGISNEVWDVLLHEELGKVNYDEQQAFYQAHMSGDEATKSNYHSQYFPQTLAALQKHVDYILNELGELGVWQMTGLNADRHPRLPLIMRHNEFVKNTFDLVKQNLNNMSS